MSPQSGDRKTHWLERPDTIRKLRIGGLTVLALTLLATLVWPLEDHFGFDGWFAFPAVLGIVSALVLLVISKAFKFLFKRKDTYYDD